MSLATRDGFVEVGELDRREHRAEDLLARDRHLGLDVREHRRLDEVALAGADVGARAAGHERRPFALAGLDVAQHGLHLLLRGQRAEAGLRVHRIAGHHLLRAGGELVDELVLDRLVDEQARSGGADFTLAVEDADRGAADRRFDVGVRQDDVRGLAAEFQRDLLQRVGRALHDRLAGAGIAGERDLVDAGMLDDGLTELRARDRSGRSARRAAGRPRSRSRRAPAPSAASGSPASR